MIGNTPLLKLNNVTKDLPGTMYVKLEYENPGGSVKDRIALQMILDAEKKGVLKRGDTLIEPTSGSTGIGIALVGQRMGYKVVLVTTEKCSEEKKAIMNALGAELIVADSEAQYGTPNNYRTIAEEYVKTHDDAHYLNQHSNPKNPNAHFVSTGPEIWNQTGGRITHFVAGIGTGGSITGVGNFLKRCNPQIKIIGIDPPGSIYSGDNRSYRHEIEGIGETLIIPSVFEEKVIDSLIKVDDKEAFLMCRKIAREEGLLVGGSSGAAIYGAIEYARQLKGEPIIVILVPDGGERYLSKIFSDEWMLKHGFI